MYLIYVNSTIYICTVPISYLFVNTLFWRQTEIDGILRCFEKPLQDDGDPVVNNFCRDSYGFTVRPQHLEIYREYSHVYKVSVYPYNLLVNVLGLRLVITRQMEISQNKSAIPHLF